MTAFMHLNLLIQQSRPCLKINFLYLLSKNTDNKHTKYLCSRRTILFIFNIHQKHSDLKLIAKVKRNLRKNRWRTERDTPPYYKIFLSFTTFLSPKYGDLYYMILYNFLPLFTIIFLSQTHLFLQQAKYRYIKIISNFIVKKLY